jgi:hypothetical protein
MYQVDLKMSEPKFTGYMSDSLNDERNIAEDKNFSGIVALRPSTECVLGFKKGV